MNKANQKVADDTTAVNNKQTDVNNAAEAKKNADEALKNANDAQTSAQKNKDAKQAIADEASVALADANTAVKDAQAKVDAINDKLANFNTITLPAGYKDDLIAYYNYFGNSNYNQDEANNLAQDLLKYRDQAMSQNKFKDNLSDDRVVDIDNLNSTDRAELSQFVASLINQVRTQMGTNLVISSPAADDYAEQVSQNYNKDNWNSADNGKHDQSALNNATDQLNISWNGENMGLDQSIFTTDYTVLTDGTKLPTGNKQTINDLKHLIYDDFISMMFDDADSAWGHATNFAGIDNFAAEKQAVGFSLDKFYNTHYDLVEANQKVEENSYTLPSINALTQKLADAKDDLSIKQTDQASKQKANDDAQNALSSANQVLVAAQNDVKDKTATAQEANDNLTTAQNDLATLQNQLSADQANQKQAQTTFDSFDADLATKQANLQKATDSLKAEQGRLAIAQADLDNANKALSDANNNLAQKKQVVENDNETLKVDNDKLVQLQNNLSDLQNAPKLLAAAKEQVATAQKALADAQEAYNVANDKLTSLKQTAAGTTTNVSKAQQALAEAKNNEDAAKEVLDQAQQALTELRQKEALAKQVAEEQAKLAAEKEAKDNGYHIENNQVVDAKGNSVNGWTVKGNQIVSPTNATVDPAVSVTTNVNVDSKGQVQPQTRVTTNGVKTVAATESANPVATTTVQTREQYKQQLKSNNQLPQTGNNDSAILSLAGVALAAMLSLFGIKKREY